MNEYLTTSEVLELTAEIYHALPDYSFGPGYPSVVWSTRYTAKIGSANLNGWRIKLSVPLMKRASIEERKNTIAHEVCHLLAMRRARQRCVRLPPHGDLWRTLMRRAGYEPTRCHAVDNSGLVSKWEAHCGCKEPHRVSTRIRNLIKNGQRRVCRTCRKQVLLPGMQPSAPTHQPRPAGGDGPIGLRKLLSF